MSDQASRWGIRHLQCFLLFCSIALAYALRINLSVAIVAMTDNESANPDFREYVWSENVKGLLLSSFSWGYVMSQIPCGYMARRFGGKIVLLVGMSVSSVTTLLTPLGANIGDWKLLLALRVIQGMSQAVVVPSIHTLLSKWAPQEERTTMGNYCYSGTHFGCLILFGGSGFIASSQMGWPGIFYICGGLSLIWSMIWFVYGASSPSECKSISLEEKEFIEVSLSKGKDKFNALSPPWLKFLTSKPFWALLAAQCGFTYCNWTLLTETPTYMKNILGFNIKSGAFLTALPYFVMLLMGFVFAPMAACMERRKWVTVTQSRKLFNTLGSWIPAAALAGLGYIDTSLTHWAVILMIIAVGFGAAIHVGFLINHIDLSPNFAGILIGITTMSANVMSILAPIVVGFVVTEETNPQQWRIIFIIMAIISFLGNLLFVVFGTADMQPWNKAHSETKSETERMQTEN